MTIFEAFFNGGIFGGTLLIIPGPIMFLTIRTLLQQGFFSGFMVGLGTTIGNIVLALFAALFLSAGSCFMQDFQSYISIIGGILLIGLGLSGLMRSKKNTETINVKSSSITSFITSLLLTFTNPITLLSFGVFFSALNIESDSMLIAYSLVAGIAAGSILVMSLFTLTLYSFRHKFSYSVISIIDYLAGFLFIGFGIFAIFRGIWM